MNKIEKSSSAAATWIKALLLALPLLALQMVVSQGLIDSGFDAPGIAFAQDEDDEKKADTRETRRTPALRNKVYERLQEAQVFIEAKQYQEAIAVLKDMEEESGKKALNSYELANLYNLFAYVYYSQEDYTRALQAYENVAKQEDIPLAMEVNTRYTIAQLYFVMEEWQKGINALMQWFKVADAPSAQAYIFLGQGYYQLKDYNNALKNTLIAVNMYKEKGKVPKEQWYSLLRFLYFEQDNVAKTVETLEELVVYYPKKQYWVQLSAMYGESRDEKNQLAAMETAYVQDMLEKDREQVTMAYLYLNAEAPYKAAQVLAKGLKNKSIEGSSKNLEILGNSWRQAQEIKKSIPVMEQAAEKSDKGDLYCNLGSVFLDNDNFKQAAAANVKGLARGGVKRTDSCELVLGMAYFNLANYTEARKAFKSAAKDERSEKYAKQWIKYMDNEIDRQAKLQED